MSHKGQFCQELIVDGVDAILGLALRRATCRKDAFDGDLVRWRSVARREQL